MKAGPKAAVDHSVLPFRPRSTGSLRFASFCEKFIRVPKGTGRALAAAAATVAAGPGGLGAGRGPAAPHRRLDDASRARQEHVGGRAAACTNCFSAARAPSSCVVAVDERQAGIVFNIARRMVELDDELSSRCQVFKERLRIPARDAQFHCLPAEPKRLEGLDYTLAILDEAGVASRDTYEVLTLAQGKREQSTLIAIGTPGPDPNNQVLADLRNYAAEHPDDKSLVWREFSAAGFEDHPVDCQHCWELANPALDDFLHRDAMHALLPPKTREATFRRARLCQFATRHRRRIPSAGVWDGLQHRCSRIPDGAEVIVALDGSFSDDTTALLAGTVSTEPHFDTIRVWQRNNGDDSYRVPVAEVEQEIRDACRRWRVLEISADPFRWTRTLQALEAERLPVVEFPHSPSRLTAATGDLYSAAVNGRMSHSGNGAARRPRRGRGDRRRRPRDATGEGIPRTRHAAKIDLAACLVMAHSRATWRATHTKRKRAYSSND